MMPSQIIYFELLPSMVYCHNLCNVGYLQKNIVKVNYLRGGASASSLLIINN
jgi:hypothetical protein